MRLRCYKFTEPYQITFRPLSFTHSAVHTLIHIEYSLECRAKRRGYAKSFGIHIWSNFHCVARLAGVDKLVFGRLDKQSVLALGIAHTLDALLVGIHKDVLARIHVLPHLVVQTNGRALWDRAREREREREREAGVEWKAHNRIFIWHVHAHHIPVTAGLTLKKSQVEPCSNVPYCTSVCMAKSSGELIGVTMRSTVRNAARLAVYDEMRMSVKKNQEAAAMRPDMERGDRSQPCCMNAEREYQKEFKMLNSLTAEEPLVPTEARLPAERDACSTAAAQAADCGPGVGGPGGGGGTVAPPMMPGGC